MLNVSQMKKADGFVKHCRDVRNLKFQKHERVMKKALNCWLSSVVVDPEVCQGLTTDEVKADLRNVNPTKAAGPDKIHPRILHHVGPVSISMLMSVFNKSWAETKVPQEWKVADICPIQK